MGAHKCYNDKVVSDEVQLFYMFECKKCSERWFGSFCQCPKCKEKYKYRILSSEMARQEYINNYEMQRMAVYGLLKEYYKK